MASSPLSNVERTTGSCLRSDLCETAEKYNEHLGQAPHTCIKTQQVVFLGNTSVDFHSLKLNGQSASISKRLCCWHFTRSALLEEATLRRQSRLVRMATQRKRWHNCRHQRTWWDGVSLLEGCFAYHNTRLLRSDLGYASKLTGQHTSPKQQEKQGKGIVKGINIGPRRHVHRKSVARSTSFSLQGTAKQEPTSCKP